MTSIESEREIDNPVAFPRVSDAQLARLRAYGTPQTVEAGEVLYGPGDATYDLVVTEDASRTTAPPEGSSSSAAQWIQPRSRFAPMHRGDGYRTSGSTPTPSPDSG